MLYIFFFDGDMNRLVIINTITDSIMQALFFNNTQYTHPHPVFDFNGNSMVVPYVKDGQIYVAQCAIQNLESCFQLQF